MGYGRNKSVNNDIYEYSPITLSWKLLKSPDVRPLPRYNQIWHKSNNKI